MSVTRDRARPIRFGAYDGPGDSAPETVDTVAPLPVRPALVFDIDETPIEMGIIKLDDFGRPDRSPCILVRRLAAGQLDQLARDPRLAVTAGISHGPPPCEVFFITGLGIDGSTSAFSKTGYGGYTRLLWCHGGITLPPPF